MSADKFTSWNVSSRGWQAVLGVGVVFGLALFCSLSPGGAPSRIGKPRGAEQRLAESFRQATVQVLPALVTVEVLRGPRETRQWAMRERRLSDSSHGVGPDETRPNCSPEPTHDSTGSGIIIDRRGYVLTCNHVVAAADVVFVRLPDGRRLEALEVSGDAVTDLAVIRIEGEGELPEAPVGNSRDLAVGDWIVSIGDPYGLGLSVTAGIVSATDRCLPDTPWTPLIQSDAGSSPGNSGGALVNLNGEVIGISEGGYGAHAGSHAIGFAIPINAAMRIARQLIEHGAITRGYLGCRSQELSPEIARHLGLPLGNGLIVCEVTPQSPAAVAGIQLGDVLREFAGTPIRDAYHLSQLLEEASLGKHYQMSMFRDGKAASVEVRLESMPEHEGAVDTPHHRQSAQPAAYTDASLGVALDELLPESARQLGFDEHKQGVLVTQVTPGGAAYQHGICAGMLILRLGDHRTPNLKEYRKAMNDPAIGEHCLVMIGTPEGNHATLLRKGKTSWLPETAALE